MMSDQKSDQTDMEENVLNASSKERTLQIKGTEKRGSTGLDQKIKTYGLLNTVQETEEFLLANPDIIDGQTALLLLQWCTAISDDPDTFNNVSRQCIYIIYLYDLSRQIDIEPVHCVSPFFAKINEPTFHERFEREIAAYRNKLQALTFNEVLDEVLIPREDISSSGDSSTTSSEGDTSVSALDPLEVYENLPDRIKECLDDEDLYALEHEFSELPLDQAMLYFVQMVKSGLLLPIENNNEDHKEVDDNSSDMKFDSESKSSNEKYAELLECLKDVDLEQFSEDLDKDDDTNWTSDCDERENEENKRV
ncbi:hypothetical protein WDU94_013440 [Cyamophila willieti]